MTELEDLAVEFLEIVKSAKKAYVLTGAGVSTPSGIPDFRGKDGIYKKMPPDIFDIERFYKDPKRYYTFHKERISLMKKAEPNPVHLAIARLEELGMIDAVITQNIDGLHRKAGSSKVIELHGTVNEYVCTRCGRIYPAEEIDAILESVDVPKCEECGGLIKPNVVFFGEALPERALVEAFKIAEEADLAIAVGTSLIVYPAALIPRRTVETGGKLVIITLGGTGLDSIAFRKYEVELSEFFKLLLENLRGG